MNNIRILQAMQTYTRSVTYIGRWPDGARHHCTDVQADRLLFVRMQQNRSFSRLRPCVQMIFFCYRSAVTDTKLLNSLDQDQIPNFVKP